MMNFLRFGLISLFAIVSLFIGSGNALALSDCPVASGASRSFKITLQNITNLTLKLKSASLDHGIWSGSGNQSPQNQIAPMSKVCWQSESDGFGTGTAGDVTYESAAGELYISWSDPFEGGNELIVDTPARYNGSNGAIGGDNASVQIILAPQINTGC